MAKDKNVVEPKPERADVVPHYAADKPPAEPAPEPGKPVAAPPKPAKPAANCLDVQLVARIDRMLQKVRPKVRLATVKFLHESYEAQASEEGGS